MAHTMWCSSTTQSCNLSNPSCSPNQGWKAPLLIALEIIFGCAVISVGIYLAHTHGVKAIYLVGLGTLGTVGVVFLAIKSISCLRKTDTRSLQTPKMHNDEVTSTPSLQATEASRLDVKSTQSRTQIKGKIAIVARTPIGVLGDDISQLAFSYPATHKVMRTDLKDWKTNPSELLFECQIFDAKKNGLSQIFLPLVFFVHNDNYLEWKKDGDTVEFFYDTIHYILTLSQMESIFRQSIASIFNRVQTDFNRNEYGVPYYPLGENEEPKFFPSLFSLEKEKNEYQRAQNTAIELQDKFKQFNQNYIPKFPREPTPYLTNTYLICEMPGVLSKDISIFINESAFAIYGKKSKFSKSQFQISELQDVSTLSVNKFNLKNDHAEIVSNAAMLPEFNDCEFLLIIELNDLSFDGNNITKEMIQNGKWMLREGQFYLIWAKT